MKFKYIGPNGFSENGLEIPVNTYGGANVLNGETIELDGHLAEKAMKNPNYEEVKTKPKAKKAPKLEAVEEVLEEVSETN